MGPGIRGNIGAGMLGNRGPSGAGIPENRGPSGAGKFIRGWDANPRCGANGWRIGPCSRIGPCHGDPCHGDPCDGACHGDPCDGGCRMPRLGTCPNAPNGM
jgi:hypothetical protein